MKKKTFLALLICVSIIIGSLIIGSKGEFGGADGQIQAVIGEVDATYEPWFKSFWTPPSGEIESLLFALQAAFFGIVGLSVGISVIIVHLLSLESLGQPYLMPVFPLKKSDLKDSFVRLPMQFMKKRPHTAKPINYKRGRKNEE